MLSILRRGNQLEKYLKEKGFHFYINVDLSEIVKKETKENFDELEMEEKKIRSQFPELVPEMYINEWAKQKYLATNRFEDVFVVGKHDCSIYVKFKGQAQNIELRKRLKKEGWKFYSNTNKVNFEGELKTNKEIRKKTLEDNPSFNDAMILEPACDYMMQILEDSKAIFYKK